MQRLKRHGFNLFLLFAAILAVVLFVFSRSAGGQAQVRPRPDAGKGQQLAERLCTTCHVVSSQSSGPAIAGVPTFHAIANHAGQTPERLAGALIIPHQPLPSIPLSHLEVRDIISYILSLKTSQ